jgi:AcrR family transcriptional regulator
MVTTKASANSKLRGKHEDSREAVLEASLELFAAQGYEATSIDEIRAAVGFKSKASLYTHFKSKEEISNALLKRILEKIDQIINTAKCSSKQDPLSQYCAVFRAYIEWGLKHRHEFAFRIIRAQEIRMLTGHYDFQGATFDPKITLYPTIVSILESLRTNYPVRPIENDALFHMTIGAISRAVIDQDTFGAISLNEKVDQIFQVCVGIIFSHPIAKLD